MNAQTTGPKKRGKSGKTEAEVIRDTLLELQERESDRFEDFIKKQEEREEKTRKLEDQREEKREKEENARFEAQMGMLMQMQMTALSTIMGMPSTTTTGDQASFMQLMQMPAIPANNLMTYADNGNQQLP